MAAHEPFVKRYRGKLSPALDRRIYSRIDRLASGGGSGGRRT